ncbi:hypothetical protein B0H19DRAFT_1067613 [Mycena capillaripes]|nr:hypothetical protein B0H19DRAFT_1067613 [Mycena capillaripes]
MLIRLLGQTLVVDLWIGPSGLSHPLQYFGPIIQAIVLIERSCTWTSSMGTLIAWTALSANTSRWVHIEDLKRPFHVYLERGENEPIGRRKGEELSLEQVSY